MISIIVLVLLILMMLRKPINNYPMKIQKEVLKIKDHYKIEYGKIIHTIELNEKDLDVVRKLHKRRNPEYNNGVIDFYDLDKGIIDDLKWADLIEIRNSIIFLSCDTINLLIRKE